MRQTHGQPSPILQYTVPMEVDESSFILSVQKLETLEKI